MTRLLRSLCLALAAAVPASALTHSISDFRNDWSGAAADTFRLDFGWRDSLLLDAQRYEYKTDTVFMLNNVSPSTNPAAGPIAAAVGQYSFKVAYLQWAVPHNPGNAGSPGLANIVSRDITLDPDTATIGAAGIIAGQEVPGRLPPTSPVFMNFMGEGGKYAAYWGSNSPGGPIRRTTYRDAQGGGGAASWGQNVPPAAPVAAPGFGKVGSGMQPGAGGTKYALAYETQAFPTGKFEVRWEDIDAGTSVASAQYATTLVPEDFAVAMDSLGNTVVLWREQQPPAGNGRPSDMHMVAFDASHAEIFPPTTLAADIFSNDTINTGTNTFDHYYRPFAVASPGKKRFLIAFGTRSSATVSNIYYRAFTIDSLGPGVHDMSAPVALTPVAGDAAPLWYMYPDIAVSKDRVAFAWYKRSSPAQSANNTKSQRMAGSIFSKVGGVIDASTRIDLDLAGENISFGPPTNGLWYQYHYFKAANIAMDDKGNIVAAYDSGASAKVALVKNTPIYYDSSAFVSKVLKVENPSIPSFVFDPARDSVAFQPFRVTTNDTAYTRVKLATAATAGGVRRSGLPAPSRARRRRGGLLQVQGRAQDETDGQSVHHQPQHPQGAGPGPGFQREAVEAPGGFHKARLLPHCRLRSQFGLPPAAAQGLPQARLLGLRCRRQRTHLPHLPWKQAPEVRRRRPRHPR